jgi:hypothetical protein
LCIINAALIWYFGFENTTCQVVGMHCKYFLAGRKGSSTKNVFTMEGRGKGNGIPCSSVGDREQDEVTKLKDFNMDGGSQCME